METAEASTGVTGGTPPANVDMTYCWPEATAERRRKRGGLFIARSRLRIVYGRTNSGAEGKAAVLVLDGCVFRSPVPLGAFTSSGMRIATTIARSTLSDGTTS